MTARLEVGGWPTCGVCGRLVERLESSMDVFKRQWTVRAQCCGQVEDVVATEEEIVARGVFLGGVAFRDESESVGVVPRLGPGSRERPVLVSEKARVGGMGGKLKTP